MKRTAPRRPGPTSRALAKTPAGIAETGKTSLAAAFADEAGLEAEVDELSHGIHGELVLDQQANRNRRVMARQRMADKQARSQIANNQPHPVKLDENLQVTP